MHVSNGVRSNVLKECRAANAQGIQTLFLKHMHVKVPLLKANRISHSQYKLFLYWSIRL